MEHPFGTLKRWLGWDHFLVRGFAKIRGEMSLTVLGYNFLRMINLLGVSAFRDHSPGRTGHACQDCRATGRMRRN